MRESQVEKYLVKRTKEMKGEIRKVKWIGHRGAPDRVLFIPRLEPFFIELKAPGKKLENHQKREHKRLKKLGVKIYTLDCVGAIDSFFETVSWYFDTFGSCI